MPVGWSPYRRWQDVLGARPGESRDHAAMRSDRSHRKRLRKLRRQGLA